MYIGFELIDMAGFASLVTQIISYSQQRSRIGRICISLLAQSAAARLSNI